MLWFTIVSIVLLGGAAMYFLLLFFFPKKKSRELPMLSAKLKNIFIELHNYKFFHSPEGTKKTYNRYIGRIKLREKLKTILTNSETRSGAYLVTGFRGMGKTSLVRKAISEIKGNHYYALSRHLRIFFFSVVIYLLDRSLEFSIDNISFTLIALNIFGVWYLVWHDQNRPNVRKYYRTKYLFPFTGWLRDVLISILKIFDLEADYYKRSKFNTLLQDTFVVSAICSIFYFTREDNSLIILNVWRLFLLSFYHFIIIYILNNLQIELSGDPEKRRVVSFFKALRRIFINAISRLDYGNKISIEISLSQDDLKEIDILKLLAKNVYSEYRHLRNRVFAPNRLILPLITGVTIYFALGLLYYNNTIYDRLNELRLHSPIVQYFPSQALFPDDQKFKLSPDITAEEYVSKINEVIVSNTVRYGRGVPEEIPIIEDYEKGQFRHLMMTIDFTLQFYYQKFFQPLMFKPIGKNRMSPDFQFFPNIVDYTFVLLILLVLGLIALLEKIAWRFGIINHRYVLKRLKSLNENIAAQIVMEQGKSGGASGGMIFRQAFNFFNKKTRAYPIAGVREIENELIDILNEIDKIPSISGRPEFIFIFDELDKIEAQYNSNIQEKEREELASFSAEDEGYFSTESIRRRQETIARILGNLKLFFNTARAKFIFIAGREMYDASLADISDRESFISSIFHEIIYVESFFKDQGSEGGGSITSTTEEFVCQLLIPRFSRYHKNLKGYNQYLKDNFSTNDDPLRILKKWINKKSTVTVFDINYAETDIQKRNRHKIIYTLEQFITFLTYRGNGAPKKITKLLEEFVMNVKEADLTSANNISAARNCNNLYLHFDYTCQYRLGLTNYLFKPYLIANTGHMRDFGDKMLIATSFLMDHLYKYHKVGFSWDNLELTPEIIAINKSPELRRYISRLIDFMANSHIEEIINGLYQFKFTIRIAAEIMYISTISEVEAAAFNFTLDESLLLKRHYRKKLKSLGGLFNNQNGNHIDSIAYINTILGDLHFYDREYDEALIHYENAGQFIGNKTLNELSISEFIFLIRHLLKVGVTYEKTKDYDSAFVSYGKLTKHIRDFSSKSLLGGESIRVKRKLFENIRLIFQPLLAQFQIVEKGGPNGVTMEDVARVIDEFYLSIHLLESEEKFIIEVEFFNKVSDLLYYKNGSLISKNNLYYSSALSQKKKEVSLIIKRIKNSSVAGVYPQQANTDFKAPLTAYRLYEKSLLLFAERLHELTGDSSYDGTIEKAFDLAIQFVKKSGSLGRTSAFKTNKPKDLLIALGGNLSDLADTIICFFTDKKKVEWKFLTEILGSGDDPFSEDAILDNFVSKKLNPFTAGNANTVKQAFFILFLANQVFLRAGDYYRCLFQLKKILIIIKRLLDYGGGKHFNTINSNNYNIVRSIGAEAIRILDRSITHTRSQQVYEWKNYFDVTNESEINDLQLESLINQPEGREVVTIIKEIELYLRNLDPITTLARTNLGLSHSIMNNKYNRVFELYYKCTLNFECFKVLTKSCGLNSEAALLDAQHPLELLLSSVSKSPELAKLKIGSPEEVIIFLITDSIYCLSEVLRSFNVFGITYICNHSLNAIVHDHLAKWCFYYQHFKKLSRKDADIERFISKVEETLSQLLGKIDIQYLDVDYHLKMALQHCYSSLEMHQGGTAYKRAIEQMHYLDDDFDDNLSHFCAAIERYRINSGFIRVRIKALKEKLKEINKNSETQLL
ncbi:MAG: hypothetical protein ABJG47_03890 [Ekhidna sp.]